MRSPLVRALHRRLRPAAVRCRAATGGDAAGVARLIEPLFPPSASSEAQPSAERLLSETIRAGGEYRVAEAGGGIVAGCQVGPLLESAGFGGCWVLGLWVHPDMRGRGVGEALVRDAVGAAARRGERAIYCHIAPNNEASLGLFHKIGFSDGPSELRLRIAERFGSAFGDGAGLRVLQLELDCTRGRNRSL